MFEVGAGAGEDALALQRLGYRVLATDYVKAFVDQMTGKGIDATTFDATSDDFPIGFDALYANAVFVHFSPQQTKVFLEKAKAILVGPKLVFLSVIRGDSQERRVGSQVGFERDFQDYTEEMITEVLRECGFGIVKLEIVDDKWIQIVASGDSN